MKLEKLFLELEQAIPSLESKKDSVSKASVGWQIEHALRVIMGICHTLKKSDPKEYKWSFNPKRTLLLNIGHFPRGVAKAPKPTRPVDKSDQETLKKYLAKAKSEVLTIDDLPKNSFFKHPVFNHLNLKQSQRFLVLHTFHHIKIIRDILK